MTGEGEGENDASLARRTGKSEAAFRTISEVADDLDVPQHVLRFWEGKFPQVRPLKRGGGRRYYRPEEVALLRRIRDLLYSEGYTIKGVQKLLREGGVREVESLTVRPAELELQLGESSPKAEAVPQSASVSAGADAPEEGDRDEDVPDLAVLPEMDDGEAEAESCDGRAADGDGKGMIAEKSNPPVIEDDEPRIGALLVPEVSVSLRPEIRKELEGILTELEHLRSLLQPR